MKVLPEYWRAAPSPLRQRAMPPNPIQRFLDQSGIPWRQSRGALIEKFGLRDDPWTGRKIVLLDTPPPILPGLIRPLALSHYAWLSPDVPSVYLHGYVSVGEIAKLNLEVASLDGGGRL